MTYSASSLIIKPLSISPPNKLENSFGVVEGFSWSRQDGYSGQHGDYTHAQRRRLLQFMADKGLNIYVYSPKIVGKQAEVDNRTERTLQLPEGEAAQEWQDTFRLAKKLNIIFIWGLTHNFSPHTDDQLIQVVQAVTSPPFEAAGVALLMDDLGGNVGTIPQQAQLLHRLYEKFEDKITAYCPPHYGGDPKDLEKKLADIDRIVPKPIPFVFTGLAGGWNRTLKFEHFPTFVNRRIIVWDNWISGDTIALKNFTVSPPMNRETPLLQNIASYWLNLNFPVERAIPAVSSVAFLQTNKRSPREEELEKIWFGQGRIADEWAKEVGYFSHFTRAVLKVRQRNCDEIINPCAEDIVQNSDLHSLELLLQVGLDIHAPIRTNKTWMRLAVEQKNYPFAWYLFIRTAKIKVGQEWDKLRKDAEAGIGAWCQLKKEAEDVEVNWQELNKAWKLDFNTPTLRLGSISRKKSQELRETIVSTIDKKVDYLSLQNLLNQGVSALTKNYNEKSLAECAEDSGHIELAAYLGILEEREKEEEQAFSEKADAWAKEKGCSSHFANILRRVEKKNSKANPNPNAEEIVHNSDLYSLHLLLEEGLDLNIPIKENKTWMQLAIDKKNYLIAWYLHFHGAQLVEENNIATDSVPLDIVKNTDLHSFELLMQGGLDIKAPIRPGQTWMQIAVEQKNYPFAWYLFMRNVKAKEGVEWSKLGDDARAGGKQWNQLRADAEAGGMEWYKLRGDIENDAVNWKMLKEDWKQAPLSHRVLSEEKSKELGEAIVTTIDKKVDYLRLQNLLAQGVSAQTTNANRCSLAICAAWSGHLELAGYLSILEEQEKSPS